MVGFRLVDPSLAPHPFFFNVLLADYTVSSFNSFEQSAEV